MSDIKVSKSMFFIYNMRLSDGKPVHEILMKDIESYEEAQKQLQEVKQAQPDAYIFEGTYRV